MKFDYGILLRFWSRRSRVTGFTLKGLIPCLFIVAIVGGAHAATQYDNGTEFTRPDADFSKRLIPAPMMQLAQSGDANLRINQLEENIRRLNGLVEELNFQLLQMQEQMRKMQEDNEFRFQELEEKRQGRLNRSKTRLSNSRKTKTNTPGKRQPSESIDTNSNSDGRQKIVKTAKKPRMIDGVEIYQGDDSGRESPLGSITFDSLGNVVDSAQGKPLDLTSRLPDLNQRDNNLPRANSEPQLDGAKFASVGSAKQLYELAYEYFQAGDYANSKEAFGVFVERYPDNGKTANAQFWLGESMFSQSNFEGAAKAFLKGHTNWPGAKIAPQTLLKLGVSLAGMNQRELACATYAKVYRKYPKMSNTMRNRVKGEQNSAQCLNG